MCVWTYIHSPTQGSILIPISNKLKYLRFEVFSSLLREREREREEHVSQWFCCQNYVTFVIDGLSWSIGGMILTGKPKYWEKNLSRFHFVHHKFRMNWPGIEPGPPRPLTNRLSHYRFLCSWLDDV